MLSDAWQILCVCLSLPSLHPAHQCFPRHVYWVLILRAGLPWEHTPSCFKHLLLTGSTHHCWQILCSAIHVASFVLEYIFFWAEPVLLGYGSTQTPGSPLPGAYKGPSRGCRVEEFEGAEGSGLTALFGDHTWHLTRQCKKQEHIGRWELYKWALPLNASLYSGLHCLEISIVKVRNQMDLRTYSYVMEVEG